MPLAQLYRDRLHFLDELPRPEAMKKMEEPVGNYESPDIIVEDASANGVPVLVYKPRNASGQLPVLIWMHGGGFQFGTYKMNEGDIVSREMCDRAGIVVVNVEYRLVNETVKFPAPQDDCLAALDWVVANLESLGARRDAIFIGGISAGACLAATTAVLDRDRGTNYLKGQLLNCPLLHRELPPMSPELEAKLKELNGFYIPADTIKGLNEFTIPYVGAEKDNPAWRPGDLADLSGLPIAQIINCEYDTLRMSGELYGEQLNAAGVKTEVLMQASVPHAHINRLPVELPEMVETLEQMVRWVRENS